MWMRTNEKAFCILTEWSSGIDTTIVHQSLVARRRLNSSQVPEKSRRTATEGRTMHMCMSVDPLRCSQSKILRCNIRQGINDVTI
jgi:hypothetical protein